MYSNRTAGYTLSPHLKAIVVAFFFFTILQLYSSIVFYCIEVRCSVLYFTVVMLKTPLAVMLSATPYPDNQDKYYREWEIQHIWS